MHIFSDNIKHVIDLSAIQCKVHKKYFVWNNVFANSIFFVQLHLLVKKLEKDNKACDFFNWLYLSHWRYSTVMCKLLLNWPQRKIGQHFEKASCQLLSV